jgi:hypothetical protein
MANIECRKCNDTGLVLLKDQDGRSWAVACDCKKGNDKVYDGRTLEKDRSPYIIPRYSDIFKTEPKKENNERYEQTRF